MKIAEFGHKHVFSSEGGIEVVVTEQTIRYAKESNLVTVFDRWELDKPERKYIKVANLRIVKVPTLSNSKVNAQLYSMLASVQCLLDDFDIIHIHAEGTAVFLPLLKLFGKKVVVTVHGLDWQRAKWGRFASSYIQLGEEMIAKYADGIIVLNQETQNYFRDRYNRRSVIIPNGVTVYPTNETNLIEQFGLERNGYILFMGRFVPEKRLDLLVDAFLEANMSKKLVLAGTADDSVKSSEWYEKAAKSNNIIFTGFADGRLKSQLYSNASLAVLPSDLEGMSISLLEALGYGIRVLVSDVPENKAIVKEYGDTFKASDVGDLKRMLEVETKKPFMRGKEQYQYIKDNHSWDVSAAQTLEFMKQIVLEGKY